MVGGSLLLHGLLLSLFIAFAPRQPPIAADGPQADQVTMLFQPGLSLEKPSSASDRPDLANAVAAGTPAPAPSDPSPVPATQAPTPVSAPAPAPPVPAPAPEPTPQSANQPIVEASIPPPAPDTPPQLEPPAPAPPPPTPAPPRQPPTVSLQVPDSAQTPLLSLPPFVPPEAPLVLPRPPAPPRPAPPRIARTQPSRNPFALNAPSNLSFNAAPSAPSVNGTRHGFDMSVSDLAGRKDSSMQYVRGAHPGADWEAKLHAWIAAHSYYPQEAASQGHEGTATVFLRIDRSGQVQQVRLIGSAHEPFLDGAWVDSWRGGVVPPFPPGTTDDFTELNYTVFYHLIRR